MAISARDLKKLKEKSAKKSKISGGFAKMNARNGRIKKFKLEKNSELTLIIPLSLALPFNPLDMEDYSYSKNNPFFFECSVEKAWEYLKEICEVDESVKDELELAIGHDITDVEWNMRGQELAHLLKNVRKIDFKSDYTVKIDLKGFNNDYPTRRVVQSEVDAAGLVKFSGVLYQISRLEQELIKPEMKALNEKLKKDGEWGHYTKKQKSIERSKVAEKARLGKPGLFSCYRILSIPVVENVPSEEDKKTLGSSNLTDFEVWSKISSENLEMYLSKLGGKFDQMPSYVEFRITTGDHDNALELYTNAQRSVAQVEYLHEVVENFYPEYLRYRDDEEHWKDEDLIKSIPELGSVDENVFIQIYESSLSGYDNALFRTEVVEKFGDLIRKVSPQKYEEIVELVASGQASDEKVADDEVTALLGTEVLDDDGNVDTEATYAQADDDITPEPQSALDQLSQASAGADTSTVADTDIDLGVSLDLTGVN